jgi:multicomponent Na+:H+ antiporter subunit B
MTEMIAFATQAIVILLLALLVGTATTIVQMRDLWAAVMLTGIFSFLGACWMLLLDAPDVAFTEAAVGAGIATFLMLGTLALTSREAKPPAQSPVLPIAVVTVTGAALVFGTFDMPHFGDPSAPAHSHLMQEFVNDTVPRINEAAAHASELHDSHTVDDSHHGVGVPNIITAVLASYRGYDTLGETVVIFTAGIGVLLLLRGKREQKTRREDAA